jgi:hypothetical protein
VRSSLPAPAKKRQRETRGQLEELEDAGRIDSFEVHAWPKRIDLVGDDQEAHEVYRECMTWAKGEDVDLEPYFDTRECYSWEDGRQYTALVLPVTCLLVYDDDGTLDLVAPHSDGDQRLTVSDFIDDLAADADSSDSTHDAPPVEVAD